MTPREPPPDHDPDAPPDERDEAVAHARALILQRRNRFIAAAIAGLGAASGGCSDSHGANPTVCLRFAAPVAGDGGSIMPRPTPCLTMMTPAGSGGAGSGGAGSGGAAGSEPRICLSIDACATDNPPPSCTPADMDAGSEGEHA